MNSLCYNYKRYYCKGDKKMSIQKQQLYNVIEELPDELSDKVIDYIEYLRFSYATSRGPEELIIKDKNDLKRKLEEGIKDTNSGNVCTLDEAFEEILAN